MPPCKHAGSGGPIGTKLAARLVPPWHSYVAASLFREPLPHLYEAGLLHETTRKQSLALGEVLRMTDRLFRRETEDSGELSEISWRIHSHKTQVVALREHIGMDLGRALR